MPATFAVQSSVARAVAFEEGQLRARCRRGAAASTLFAKACEGEDLGKPDPFVARAAFGRVDDTLVELLATVEQPRRCAEVQDLFRARRRLRQALEG